MSRGQGRCAEDKQIMRVRGAEDKENMWVV
jgi:hypothetical protein